MALPTPEPGLVISYEFLWRNEADQGLEYGRKHRPCAVIVAITNDGGETETIVAPITHSRPTTPTEGIEIPGPIRTYLGLDDEPAWVIITDLNRFIWPGFDLSPVPGGKSDQYAYGILPPKFFNQIKNRILAIDAKLKAITSRD